MRWWHRRQNKTARAVQPLEPQSLLPGDGAIEVDYLSFEEAGESTAVHTLKEIADAKRAVGAQRNQS